MTPVRRPAAGARPWPLRLSLVANLVLLLAFATVARREADQHRAAWAAAAALPAPTVPEAGVPAADDAAPAAALIVTNWIPFTWPQVADADLREYTRKLREAAFPEPVVRDLITSEIEARFASRWPERPPEANYWATGAERRAYNEAFAAARREGIAEYERMFRETLGIHPPRESDAPRLEAEIEDVALLVMFGHLPEPARGQAVALYQEMRGLGKELDVARIRPELEREVDEFKRRHAEWARRLHGLVGGSALAETMHRVGSLFLFGEDDVREALAEVRPTPAELRALAGAVVAGEDPFRWEFGNILDLGEWDVDEDILLNAAEPGFRAVLGEARYAVYDRARTRFYRDVRGQVQEGKLPAGTAEAA
ncbi:MAG TPA: hypothetical protein PKE47_11645, partial [Verrucomicrobiota bacterium]|nr:hypothetical protein [Verrucomicrobiota bacterium]